jgi:hypothetical protein
MVSGARLGSVASFFFDGQDSQLIFAERALRVVAYEQHHRGIYGRAGDYSDFVRVCTTNSERTYRQTGPSRMRKALAP